MKKGIYSLVCFTVFALMVGWGQPAKAVEPTGELRIGLENFHTQVFHPLWATVFRKVYLEPMYDYLIGIDEKGNFDEKKSIAYKWEEAPDKMSWTLWIRDGVKFHNGDPLTNEDVQYSIMENLGPQNLAFSRAPYTGNINRVETVPPNKVVVYLKKPWPVMLYFFSPIVNSNGMIQPKKYLQGRSDKDFQAKPVGSGPYRLLESKENVHIKLVAQDSHWRVGVPRYKYLTFKLMPEEGTRVAALKAGDIDITKIGLSRLKEIKEAGFKTMAKKGGIFVDLKQLYHKDAPTHKSKEVREALFLAIDRKAILDEILMGQGELVGTAGGMMTWDIAYKPYPIIPYDPVKAKRLLAEAGYPNGFDVYLYSFTSVLPEAKLITEAIAANWEAIGMKVKILELEYSAFLPIWRKQKPPRGGPNEASYFLMPYANRAVHSYSVCYDISVADANIDDPKIPSIINEFETSTTLEQYITRSQKIMDYVQEMHWEHALMVTDELWASRKDLPSWEFGKGTYSCRWEEIQR